MKQNIPKTKFSAIFLVALLFLNACHDPVEIKSRGLAVIPKPVSTTLSTGHFELRSSTRILLAKEDAELRAIGDYITAMVAPATGFALVVEIQENSDSKNVIHLEIDPALDNPEMYTLSSDKNAIHIVGGGAVGVFHGVQTLRQLLPPQIESKNKVDNVQWAVQSLRIEDKPTYNYRGLHLDVGRHFFPVSFIKKYIDLITLHKMNVFHWHLTDDQGWRVEIKKYPKLAEVGGFRKETLIGHGGRTPFEYDGVPYGGFYTQDEIREVVAYAKERHVTVIPEIEMPGHAQAALTAYPELGCTGGPYEVATRWGVFPEVFCAGKDHTFDFLEDVLTEVAALFPGQYIHIGGDECPKDRWKVCPDCQARIKAEGLKDEHELQSYFIRRIEKFLLTKNRNIIGWDEILEGGLAPMATVMSWRGMEGGIEAARQQHDVIMTPGSHCYLDHYQADPETEPLAIGGFTTLEKVYSFEPMPEVLNAEEQEYVLGAQANVWSEYMKTTDYVEYMVFPRAIALAENLWTPRDQQDFQDFASRLQAHFTRLDIMGVNYANKLFDLQVNVSSEEGGVAVTLEKAVPRGDIYYTLDGSEPDPSGLKYDGVVLISSTGEFRAQTFVDGAAMGTPASMQINMHKAAGKKISFMNPPAKQYSMGGNEVLINGIFANPARHVDKEWLGFSGDDVVAIIDLGAPTTVSRVGTRFYQAPGSWVYIPRRFYCLVP